MKKALALLLACVMVIGLCACGAQPAAQEAAPAAKEEAAPEQKNVDEKMEEVVTTAETVYADTVTFGLASDVDTFDPFGGTSAQTEQFTNMTFDTVVYNNPETGNIDPELAESWEVNADNTEWTFHLVQNAVFHNGDKLTAEDVAFTFQYAANLDGATNVVKPFTAGTYGTPEVIDDYTVKFVLNSPMPDFPAYMEMKVYSKNAIETLGHAEGSVIGTGPWMYSEADSVSGQYRTLKRNPNYWRDQDDYKTETFVIKIYGDSNANLAAFEAGEVDFIMGGVTSLATARANPEVNIGVKTGCAIDYMGFNYGSKTCDMNDPEIRIAICQCIDKEAIIAVALEGEGVATGNFCVPSGLGYSADVKPLEYDPEAGAATLAAKGVTHLTLVHYASRAKHAEVIQQCLAQAGVDVTVQQVDSTNWTTFKAAQDGYDIFLDYCSYRGALLYNYNRFLYRGGSSNVFGFGSDEYEAVQDNVTAQTSWEDMVVAFKDVQQWVADNCPLFPTVIGNMYIYAHQGVECGYIGGSQNAMDYSKCFKVVEG